MNEYTQGLIGTLGLVIPVIFSLLYWLGGRYNGRLIRRWVAPIFFTISVIAYSLLVGGFHWLYLLSIPAYKGITHIGYGGDTTAKKFFRRLLWSVLYSACAFTFVMWSGAWILFIVQTVISILTSILFGILNPFKSAPKEEGIICFSSSFLIPYMV